MEENLDYEIDVETLVEDMILSPEEGFGFMFRLVNEDTYNSLLFASSDNADATLHPKLLIVYDREQQSILPVQNELDLSIYPNPADSVLNFDFERVDIT